MKLDAALMLSRLTRSTSHCSLLPTWRSIRWPPASSWACRPPPGTSGASGVSTGPSRASSSPTVASTASRSVYDRESAGSSCSALRTSPSSGRSCSENTGLRSARITASSTASRNSPSRPLSASWPMWVGRSIASRARLEAACRSKPPLPRRASKSTDWAGDCNIDSPDCTDPKSMGRDSEGERSGKSGDWSGAATLALTLGR